MAGVGRNREYVDIGYVAAAYALAGGLQVRLHDPRSQAFCAGLVVRLSERDGGPVRDVIVEKVAPQPGGGRVRLWVEGCTRREQADALRGASISVRRGLLPELATDEYYLADLVGLSVERAGTTPGGAGLGCVVGIMTNGAQDLLEIEWRDERGQAYAWLLPALPGFVLRFDAATVFVDVPPGFLPEPLEEVLS